MSLSYCKLKYFTDSTQYYSRNCPLCKCCLVSQCTKKDINLFAFDKIYYSNSTYVCCNCKKYFYIIRKDMQLFTIFDESIISVKYAYDDLSKRYMIIPHAETHNLIELDYNSYNKEHIYLNRKTTLPNNIRYDLFGDDDLNTKDYYLLLPFYKCNTCSEYDLRMYDDLDYCACKSKTYKVYTEVKVQNYNSIKTVKDLLDIIKEQVKKTVIIKDQILQEENIINKDNKKAEWYRSICTLQ